MRLSKAEWSSRTGTTELTDELEGALNSVGYFVLEEVVSAAVVERVRDAFVRILERHIAAEPANRGKNRYNLALPGEAPFVDPELVDNPIVMPVLRRMLGADLAVTFVAVDTPLAGSDYQRAHADGRPLFPGLPVSLPGYAYVLNIPLVEFRLDNGPLEIWPYGSHLVNSVDAQVGTAQYPPQQVLVPPGSFLVRDTRMWHRGTPNRSEEMRPNFATVYSRSWYRFGEAEVGVPPVRVSARTWNGWDLQMQSLFRFAAVEDGLNAQVMANRGPNPTGVPSLVS